MDDLAARATALDQAKALFDLIAGDSLASEQLGRPTDRVAEALHAARLFAIALPKEYGGWDAGMSVFYHVVEEIARADGSAGWCASLCNMVNVNIFSGLSEEGRDEVFGQGSVACWGAVAPLATAAREPGGYRISSPGAFGSGSSLSSWAMVASPEGPAGSGVYRAYLVPRAEVEIKAGSWDVMGLRATASVDFAVKDRFVPDRRSWVFRFTPGDEPGPMAVTEAIRLNAIGLGAFASGLAQRAMSELLAFANTKRAASPGLLAEDNVVQFGIGDYDGRLRAARTHLLALVAALDEREARGERTTPAQAVEISQAIHILTRAAREFIIFAFDCGSASMVHLRHPLQRCLRDALVGLKHAALTPALLAGIGRARLGLPHARAPL